jgi:hypothetical protein
VFTARYGLIAYIKQIYNRGGKCLQRGTDWFLIYSRYRLVFKRFKCCVNCADTRLPLCDRSIFFAQFYHRCYFWTKHFPKVVDDSVGPEQHGNSLLMVCCWQASTEIMLTKQDLLFHEVLAKDAIRTTKRRRTVDVADIMWMPESSQNINSEVLHISVIWLY